MNVPIFSYAKNVYNFRAMFKNALGRFSIAHDLLKFLWKERLWWLIPLIIVLLVLAILMIFAQSSVLAPFIYTLF